MRYKSNFPLPSIFDEYCHDDVDDDESANCLQLGFGALYNSSHHASGVDVYPIWEDHQNLFFWTAIRDIPKDKEILAWYGNDFTIQHIGEDETLRETALVEEILDAVGIEYDEDGTRTLDSK